MLAGICVPSAFAPEQDMMRALLEEHKTEACHRPGQKSKKPRQRLGRRQVPSILTLVGLAAGLSPVILRRG